MAIFSKEVCKQKLALWLDGRDLILDCAKVNGLRTV